MLVLGAGSWGTAMAIHSARLGHPVTLWARNAMQAAQMQTQRENVRYLPHQHFPQTLQVQADISNLLSTTRVIMIAVPSHAFRDTLNWLKSQLRHYPIIVWLTKGLDPISHQLLSQVAQQILPHCPLAVLSGPTFATEVAQDLPAAMTLACTDEKVSTYLTEMLHSPQLRLYATRDMAGVQLGGAVKNVLAIAVGIAEGLRCGANAQAALMTRGMAEMQRLGKVLGALPETLMGLAGLGDLILTCSNNQSRNRRFGIALGQGKSLTQALTAINQVVEGMTTAREIYQLAQTHQVDMPITTQVYRVLYQQLAPTAALTQLLQRVPKAE